MQHTKINCERCKKDVWNETDKVNQFRSSIINGKNYNYLCYDCHNEIATPIEWFVKELKKLSSPHCEQARKIVQRYRNENGGCVHVNILEVMKEQTDHYPKYL